MFKKERRYDIDWIRVIVFDILIIYHVGMFFVPWDYHIKNNEIVDWIKYPMIFINQWRIPILFVVSGMGTRFALSYRTGTEYIKERLTRLFIPLLAGVLLVVPPQVYIERIFQGTVTCSFFKYYPQTFQGLYPEGNFSWHHLWFLPYLLSMSIISTPLFLKLRIPDNKIILFFRKLIERSPFNLYLFVIPLFLIEILLEPVFPVTRALIGDWYAFAFYFVLFIIGFVCISIGNSLWIAFNKMKFYSLITGILCFSGLLWIWFNTNSSFLIPILKTVNIWSWIITVFGFSSKYLNRESYLIKYRNQAVYPFYIVHQTVIIFIGYLLMNNSMHYFLKMTIMITGTYAISWFIYAFIICKIQIIKPFFGVKLKSSFNSVKRN